MGKAVIGNQVLPMAMAFGPQPSPCSISLRYGSQAVVARSWLPVGVKSAGQSRWSPRWSVLPASPSSASRWSCRDPDGLQVSPMKLPNQDIAVLQFFPREQAPIPRSERPAEVRFSTRLQAHQVFTSAPTREVVKWTSPRRFTHRLDSLHLSR